MIVTANNTANITANNLELSGDLYTYYSVYQWLLNSVYLGGVLFCNNDTACTLRCHNVHAKLHMFWIKLLIVALYDICTRNTAMELPLASIA